VRGHSDALPDPLSEGSGLSLRDSGVGDIDGELLAQGQVLEGELVRAAAEEGEETQQVE
jgi:hypothetical protein